MTDECKCPSCTTDKYLASIVCRGPGCSFPKCPCQPAPDPNQLVLSIPGRPAGYTPVPINAGHGHVRPRPDGMLAKCGGPALCSVCAREAAALGVLPTVAAPSIVPAAPAQRAIVALTGLAGSGKSTAALHLVNRHGFERVRFAGPLKAMVRALGLTDREIDGDLKEVPCGLLTFAQMPLLMTRVDAALSAVGVDFNEFGRSREHARMTFVGVLVTIVSRGEPTGATPRLAMQLIGTEWGRDLIDSDLWIRAWSAAVERLPAGTPVAVDDCRFPNEAGMVTAARGVVVRIERPGFKPVAAAHVSEGYALPTSVTVVNDGTQAQLLDKIDALARDLSWAYAAVTS